MRAGGIPRSNQDLPPRLSRSRLHGLARPRAPASALHLPSRERRECSRGPLKIAQEAKSGFHPLKPTFPFLFLSFVSLLVSSEPGGIKSAGAASKLPGLACAPIPCASRCAFHCRPGRALLPPPDLLALRVHSASSLFAHPVLLSAKTATSTNPELASVLPGWTSACYRGLRQSSAWA